MTSITGVVCTAVGKVWTGRRASKEIEEIKKEFVDKALCAQQHQRVAEQINSLNGTIKKAINNNKILFRMVRSLVVYNENIPKEQRKEILNERAD